jgi:hypothetical protein
MAMTYLVQAVSAQASAIRLALRLCGHRGRANHDAYPMAIVTARALAKPATVANRSHSFTVSSTVAASAIAGRPLATSKPGLGSPASRARRRSRFRRFSPRDSSLDPLRDAPAGLVTMVRKPVPGLSDAR